MRRRAVGLALVAALMVGVCLPAHGRAGLVSRVTWYDLDGLMADGAWVHDGAAACGWAIPLGSSVHVVGPDIWLSCEDTGALAPTQIDVWSGWGRPAWLTDDWYEIEVE